MTAVCLVPYRLFSDEENSVVAARKGSERANVTVQVLRSSFMPASDSLGVTERIEHPSGTLDICSRGFAHLSLAFRFS
jgi:hypothetical protein